ncbi:MAG: TRAP transporter substrate-binding protein [Oricola sp.]
MLNSSPFTRNRIAASGVAIFALLSTGWANAADATFNVLGAVSTNSTQVEAETQFYNTLAEATGLSVAVNYRNLDVAGIKMEDTLRAVGSGAFDIVQSTIGPVARDDTFLDGIDLVGVSPTLEDLKTAVEAYREVFSKRVEDRFGVKVMTLWPFGPQVFYCNEHVAGLSDLPGKKVRSYTASMSALVTALGAIPVTMSFPEVYLGLQRGVVDCAITSPTSGNTGKWPEVTANLIPAGINWAMNAHFMNLEKWNALPDADKAKLETAFKALEDEMWVRAGALSDQATACNVGSDSCEGYTKFAMKLADVTDADRAKLGEAVTGTILPEWGKACNAVYSECVNAWNASIGAARGYAIAE